jgi:hypothetical protein
MIRRMFLVSALTSMMLVVPAVAGQTLKAPSGKVMLTISGEIGQANAPDAPGEVQFDLEMLKRFPVRDIATTTYWHEGVQNFKGVSAVAVLEAAGLAGNVLTATAEDDYTIDISLEDLKSFDPIFALELNGVDLQEEAEGPVWLIFPYDRMTAEERERYTAWSIWALQRIKVRN